MVNLVLRSDVGAMSSCRCRMSCCKCVNVERLEGDIVMASKSVSARPIQSCVSRVLVVCRCRKSRQTSGSMIIDFNSNSNSNSLANCKLQPREIRIPPFRWKEVAKSWEQMFNASLVEQRIASDIELFLGNLRATIELFEKLNQTVEYVLLITKLILGESQQ